MENETLTTRLRKRAEIRRNIPTRKSVQNNEPDRIADLLEEAAMEIEQLRFTLLTVQHMVACKVECKLFIMNELEKLEKDNG